MPANLDIYCNGLDPNTPAKYCAMVYPVYPTIDKTAAAGYRHIWYGGAAGQDHVDFNFTTDSYIWGAGAANNDYGQPKIGTTGTDSDSKHYPLTMDAVIATGQAPVRAGTYYGYYYFQVNYNYVNKNVSDEALCQRYPIAPTYAIAPVPLTAKADVKPACTIQKLSDMNFGLAKDLTAPLYATGAVAITCSQGDAYEIGINSGRNADAYGTRAMQCSKSAECGQSAVQYQLFQDSAYTQPWTNDRGSAGVKKQTGTGAAQTVTIYGRTVQTQNTPPAGPYSDNIVISVFQY